MLKNPILQEIQHKNNNYLLILGISEGCTLSPSEPSEIAMVSGVFITLIKIFFDTTYEMQVYHPDKDGYNLTMTERKHVYMTKSKN